MPARVLICRATPLSPDPRVDKIARSLAAAGYTIEVLGWDMTGEHPREEQADGYLINRLRIPAQFGRGLRNVFHQLRWQAGLLSWLVRSRGKYQVVHACDFDTVLPALTGKFLWGQKVVYDIFDFYADMLRATPAGVVSLIRRLDLWAIGLVDALILADDARREQVRGASPRRCAVVYNCAEDLLDRLVEASSRPADSTGLRLCYVGNLLMERGLPALLEVLSRHPDWHLDLAGFGPDQAQLLALARGTPNLEWHGRLPYLRGLQLAYQADVLFATYDPAIPNNRYASPNKAFEAMMLGKPIIVARDTNMDRLVEKSGAGVAVPYGDRAALEDALKDLQENPALRERLGRNARQAFENGFSWVNMQRRLLELYQEVLTR